MYDFFAQLMDKKGVTPYKVAKDTGITQATLSRWKTGKVSPSIETLQILADYFQVSIDELKNGSVVQHSNTNEKNDSNDELEGVYFNFAKEAQQHNIDPDDIRLAIDTIRKLRSKK